MDILNKIKEWTDDNKNDLMLASGFFLVTVISFGLGRISVLVENQKKEPISIESPENKTDVTIKGAVPKNADKMEENDAAMGALLYVGSKNSDKYHLPDCPGALRIKEENKIWFSSKEEAEDLGYSPASNCEGL